MNKPQTPSRQSSQVQEQYDYMPYPDAPLEERPVKPDLLFYHSIVTSTYLMSQTVIRPHNKRILDAGCGTGFKTLALGEANPGAKVTGIDFSRESLAIARQRVEYHGRRDIEFHQIPLEELTEFGGKFDYINCQDVLYLVEDPVAVMTAMRAVLEDEGVIRFDFHGRYSRSPMLRAQQAFRLLGLRDQNPAEKEVELVRQMMSSLKDEILLKTECWGNDIFTGKPLGPILMNHLMQGDQAWCIRELFEAVKRADLEVIQMVNWPGWNVTGFFKEKQIPPEIESRLSQLSSQEQLEFCELVHPSKRLHDLWCCKPGMVRWRALEDWTADEWEAATIHLHPVLCTDEFRETCGRAVGEHCVIDLRVAHSMPEPFHVDPVIASILLLLMDGPMRFCELRSGPAAAFMSAARQKATTSHEVGAALRAILLRLAEPLYILIETAPRPGS